MVDQDLKAELESRNSVMSTRNHGLKGFLSIYALLPFLLSGNVYAQSEKPAAYAQSAADKNTVEMSCRTDRGVSRWRTF
ncbi:MAG: hypothetical protein DMG57_42550 [Acidobacteria bacterium]|nr:MAG: hypothetical protein DMG57_42550 [Acidobacteriota bacterium]